MARRLIINADDFGLTRGVNRAIAECHARGVATSATLMANSGAFEDAVILAKSMPALAVGCHVMLVDGESLTNAQGIASGGHFCEGIAAFAVGALTGGFPARSIEDEAGAQFSKLREAGISPTHFDTHKHTHVFPSVLKPLLAAAGDAGIRAVRNPFTPTTALKFRAGAKLRLRSMQVRAVQGFAAKFLQRVNQAGLKTTDGCFGVEVTGYLTQEIFESLLDAMPEGTWELVCHPGYNDSELSAIHTKLRGSRDMEREVLTSERTRRKIRERGIDLITFADL